MTRAPVYPHGSEPLAERIRQLRDALKDLEDLNPPEELIKKAWTAVHDIEEASKAVVPIRKGNYSIGSGVNKAEKAIACDAVMSIVRAIKSSKGW